VLIGCPGRIWSISTTIPRIAHAHRRHRGSRDQAPWLSVLYHARDSPLGVTAPLILSTSACAGSGACRYPDVFQALGWLQRRRPLLDSLAEPMFTTTQRQQHPGRISHGSSKRWAGGTGFNDALYTVRGAEPAIAGAYAMLRKYDPLFAMGLIHRRLPRRHTPNLCRPWSGKPIRWRAHCFACRR